VRICAVAQQPWDDQPRRSRLLVYSLEFGAALGGASIFAGGMALGGALTTSGGLGVLFGHESGAGVAKVGVVLFGISAAAMPAATGYAAALAGDALGEDGTAGGAVAGAHVGVPVAVGLGLLGTYTAGHAGSGWGIPLYVLAVGALPTGALVGYNLSRTEYGSARGRIGPPMLSVRTERQPDHLTDLTVCDARLMNVGF
jgi:hypothetical protein